MPKSEKLLLLEKLVQSSSEGEATSEQRDLFLNLVKETRPNNSKMREKSGDRQSRKRSKVIHKNSHAVNDQNHGKVTIPLPDPDRRSRSVSSRSRSGSSSSFWSSGSQDRARMARKSSRSSSGSSRSYSSRSRSGSCSYSSRSRSPSPPTQSTKKARERSRSPQTPKRSSTKEPRSESLSSTQSAPVDISLRRKGNIIRDSASDSGRKGKSKKLLKRGQVRKCKSFDINPDIFIEERIKRKYKELHQLLATQFSGSCDQLTSQQFQQMQTLRTQYVSASHGLPPSGVLVPRSLPANMRTKGGHGGAPRGLTKYRSKSKDTLASTSDLGEDQIYGSVQRIMNTTAAREGKVIVDPKPLHPKKKKKKVKKADSETKLNSTLDSSSSHTGSRTLSPRSRSNEQEVHHLKDCKNPDLLRWLKQKDKEHRKKDREERKKKREEREKLVLEANEKFERRFESKKVVDKWIVEKEKEYRKTLKEKRRQEKEEEIQLKKKIESSSLGNSMTVRPQTAPSNWRGKSDPQYSYKTKKDIEKNGKMNDKPQTVQDQLGTSSEHIKFDLNDQRDQLPHTSKFMYKRPVAGKIKLKMGTRPMSAQPKLQTAPTNSSPAKEDKDNKNLRMTYDEWINTKRKQDVDKRKQEKTRQKEELSKSDPEITKLVPDIAKKRIHNMLNERKSIDTGIQRYDASVNRSFGGGKFDGNKTPKTLSKGHAYKLSDDRPSTATDKVGQSLTVSGSSAPGSSRRPGTAPARRRVPMPERSPYSPIPANVPARVDQIMESEDQGNPFVLPFPPGEGAPKHVADMQRKLFSEHIISQSVDHHEQEPALALMPSSESAATHSSSNEDIKYDNIRGIDQKMGDKKENETEYLNSDSEKSREKGNSSVNQQIEKEETKEEVKEEIINDKTEVLQRDEKLDTHLDLSPDNTEQGSHLDSSPDNSGQGYDEVDSNRDQKIEDQKTDDQKEEDMKTNIKKDENELNQSNKHVSFCEEPEVFVETDQPEWSTDTGTPEEDNSRYTTKADLSRLIDNCGELLNKEYGEDDRAFMTESLDDDF